MIIVSQDKDVIVNFERINYMGITKKDDYSYSIYLNFADSDWKNIGDYRTEERAKEVLREIIDTYKFNRTEVIGQVEAVYEMPKVWGI